METASVLRAALELLRARQFPGVAAVCAEAIVHDPDNLYLRLLRARALLALRNDGDAQVELAECVRRDPRCAEAYRLLGELGIRRDEAESAAVFLREALRLDPGHREAEEWLGVAEAMTRRKRSIRPATVGEKLPAAPTAAGQLFYRFAKLDIGRREAPPDAIATPPRNGGGRAVTIDPDDPLPAASGFGRYLCEIGVVTESQLRAALAYKKATGVRVGAAIATLGFATELKIEWAALAYHGRHRKPPRLIA